MEALFTQHYLLEQTLPLHLTLIQKLFDHADHSDWGKR